MIIPFLKGLKDGLKREKPKNIVLKLQRVEVLRGQAKSVSEAVRQIGVTIQTYYRRRKERAMSPLARGQWRARHEPRSAKTAEGA